MTDTIEQNSSMGSESTADEKSQNLSAVVKAYQNPYYRYLVLGILTTAYVSNFVDRQVINVLAS